MRIAQLTDLHLRENLPGTSVLGRRRSRDAASLVARALADARLRGADLVVLTGDLVDVPSFLLAEPIPAGFDRGRWLSALAADYHLLRELLDDSGLPYIALPGNHDSYELVAETFGAGPFVRELGDLRFVSFWDREDRDNVPRRRGPERALFDELLAQPGHPQVHLQHFVVTPELNQDWPHTYADGEELRQAIVASGRVRLSLSGHYHPGTDAIRDEGTAFATGSSLCEPPHCYRLYDVPTTPFDSASPITMEVVPLQDDRPLRPAVFLPYATTFSPMPLEWDDIGSLRLVDGVPPALRDLVQAGYALVGLVDRAWVAQTKSTTHPHDAVLDRCSELLAEEGVVLDAAYVALAGDEGVSLDPPELDGYGRNCHPTQRQAAAELRLDLAGSYLIGRFDPAGPVLISSPGSR